MQKPCRCGKTNKNFKIDIGPFFVNDCCLEAGFDGLGNEVRKEVPAKSQSPKIEEAPEKPKQKRRRRSKSKE